MPEVNSGSMGNETRNSILPKGDITGMGFLGPDYNLTDDLPMPHQIGVRDEGSMSATIDAVKGVAYYVDMIGFGEASNPLTKSMGVKPKPLGINYFAKTGQSCSNGADMWMYIEGQPRGDGLGERTMIAMKAVGMPQLRGLAPGIMEDTKDALSPVPIINSLFGTGYPECELTEKLVGTSAGLIRKRRATDNPNGLPTGEPLIDNPATAYKRDGKWYQKKWIQKYDVEVLPNGLEKRTPVYLTRDQWINTPKYYNPDGTLIADTKEPFTDYKINGLLITSAILLGVFAYLSNRGKK
jgi:hypothetical protein